MPQPHLRAADSDRAAMATLLGEHMAAGRLTVADYEDRLVRVHEARTSGERGTPGRCPAPVEPLTGVPSCCPT